MQRNIGKLHWWITGLLGILFFLPATGQVSFEATSNAKEVFLNRQVEVSFVLRNADGSNFVPPDFDGFTLLSGPNQSSMSSMVNGVKSKEVGISFILLPKQKGVLTIGSASVVVNKKKLFTKPIQITVLEEDPRAQGKNAPAFLKAETNIQQAYPGQQIFLDYKIYIRPQYFKQGHQIESKPDYSGFYAEQLNYYRSYQEVVNGVDYVSMTLVRLALFPQRTGKLEIPPLTILLDVGERRSNPFGLGLAPVERLRLSANPLIVEVLPFPEGKPQTFSGAVGKYAFTSEVNRTELTTDDALSIKLFITGNGDIKQVGIPPLVGVDNFEVFDPNVLSEVLKDSGNGYLTGEKGIEYLLTPKMEGVYDIPMEFSYWDPDSNAYVISRQAPLHINVKKGSNRPSIANGPSANDEEEGLLPILTSTRLQYKGRYWINSPLFWGIGSLPFLALLGLTFFRRWQTREERMDPLLVQERRTRRVVDQHLSTARGHLQAGQFRDLFEEISRALMAYLGHKLSIPPALWSKSRVREQLTQAAVPESITSQILEILQTCEMALYAGQDKQEVAQKVFDQASNVIRQMEEKK